jgi:Carbohydrate binding domain/SdrD B-like domain/Secretion system C-terminal sorting domain
MKAILIKLAVLCSIMLTATHGKSQNLLADGGFNTTTVITPFYTDPVPYNTWSSWQNGGTSMNAVVEAGVCHYYLSNAGSGTWEVQLAQWGFVLTQNMRYRLSFDVKADANRSFGVYVGENGGGWTNLNGINYNQAATTNWQTKTMEFDATVVFPLHKLSFEMGGQNIGMYFDNVMLQLIGPATPPLVVIAGNFQSELGCSGDWMPDCNTTALSYNSGTGLYSATFAIPAGCYQYKVTVGGSWAINYGDQGIAGGANISLGVPSTGAVTFTYNPSTHLVATSPYASGFSTYCLPQVVLAGSMQNELGCSSDWDPACINSRLTFNTGSGLFEGTFMIPAGCYEYRVVENGDWVTNFGRYGNPADPNYLLSVPGATTQVIFTYDPVTHLIQSLYNSSVCQPNAVSIAGSFQSEVGCSGDWQADCINTGLQYDAATQSWVDTFFIPAGKWEFKVILNHSWAENYGMYGQLNGANYVLDVCFPSKVVFRYYHDGHWVNTQFITNGVCVTKFYDPNINGYMDYGEQLMQGISFTLTGNGLTQTAVTNAEGRAWFTDLPNGEYMIRETVPAGYYTTMADSQMVYVYDGMATANFGNVCLGEGGANGMGYWMNKQGEAAVETAFKMEQALWELRNLNLRNADGSPFDPYAFTDYRNWLQKANAKNMSHMVSAQLSVMYLNYLMGYVDGSRFVYTPGCGFWSGKFMTVDVLLWYTNYYLQFTPSSTGNDPERSYLECLKDALDRANNNLTFVQLQPCGATAPARVAEEPVITRVNAVKIWPNPSNSSFTLRFSDAAVNEPVQIRVLDITGKQVYTVKGFANNDYRFGEQFKPGVYLVELIRSNERRTMKLVKQ